MLDRIVRENEAFRHMDRGTVELLNAATKSDIQLQKERKESIFIIVYPWNTQAIFQKCKICSCSSR